MFFVEVVNGLSDTTLLCIVGISLACSCAAVYNSQSILNENIHLKTLSHISKLFITFLITVLNSVLILLIITGCKYFLQN